MSASAKQSLRQFPLDMQSEQEIHSVHITEILGVICCCSKLSISCLKQSMKDFLSELMEQTELQYKSFIKKGNDLSNICYSTHFH